MSSWQIHETDSGDRYLTSEPLGRLGLTHAFTLRHPGRSAPSRELPGSVLRALGLDQGPPVSRPVQVHGAAVARPDGGRTIPVEADTVLVERAPAAAAVATADCVGAVLAAEGTGAFALTHSGWRGTLAGAIPRAVRALSRAAGVPPHRMVLAMGPAIGGCCYEVGEELLDLFQGRFGREARHVLIGRRRDRPTVDLVAANRILAIRCGIPGERILESGICTACRRDLCWSYRIDGARAGRLWTVAALRA